MSRVFLTGRDRVGWATDDDHSLITRALDGVAEITDSLADADVIHSVNWRMLLHIDRQALSSRPVLAHIPHDVRHMLAQPRYLEIAPHVSRWLVPSRRALEMAELLGLGATHVPYVLDSSVFRRLDAAGRPELRARYRLPEDAFLVGSFQRDTEVDLVTPKYIKGPDVLLQILRLAHARTPRLHVVLAGPRRHWLKQRLRALGIPYTQCGRELAGDDLHANNLDHGTMNELYNAVDAYVVSSRMEGGPKAILECIGAGTPILSSDVGQARDLLEPAQIYANVVEAAQRLGALAQGEPAARVALEQARARLANHELAAVGTRLRDVYAAAAHGTRGSPNLRAPSPSWRLRDRRLTVYFRFHKPPWGGGNQFLVALSGALRRQGWKVRHRLGLRPTVVLLNSFHGDYGRVEALWKLVRFKVIHRIDGPTFLIRDRDRELDDKIFELNRRIVDASVFQSWWSLKSTLTLGYRPMNPLLITNATDPALFFPPAARLPREGRKIRLISASWSDNPRKGGPIYRWLDQNLDFDRFEYTFVGRVQESFDNIVVRPAVDSAQLGELLRQHDIYITASDNDPCSNSLIEALACGLPALHYARGGHPEITQFGGLGFDSREEIPARLDSLVQAYDAFAGCVQVPSIDAVADAYAHAVRVVTGRSEPRRARLARRAAHALRTVRAAVNVARS